MNKIQKSQLIKFSELDAFDLFELDDAKVVTHYSRPIGVFKSVKSWEEAQQILDKLTSADNCLADADDCADGA